MSAKSESELRNLAKGASLLAILAVFFVAAALLAGLDALTLLEPFGRAASSGDSVLFGQTFAALLHKLVPLVPVIFYVLAVLGAAGILDRIGKGEYFSDRNIRALAEIGNSMVIGAVWAALLVPAIGDWTAGIGGYRVNFQSEVIVIFVIGASLAVIGRLFLRARQLEAEMAEIL